MFQCVAVLEYQTRQARKEGAGNAVGVWTKRTSTAWQIGAVVMMLLTVIGFVSKVLTWR